MSEKISKKDVKLDEYEKDLEKNFEKAKSLSKKDKKKHLNELKTAADNYLKKDKRISIRIYGSDLDLIRQIAMHEGLPYQTLITSVLHKFATGQFTQTGK